MDIFPKLFIIPPKDIVCTIEISIICSPTRGFCSYESHCSNCSLPHLLGNMSNHPVVMSGCIVQGILSCDISISIFDFRFLYSFWATSTVMCLFFDNVFTPGLFGLCFECKYTYVSIIAVKIEPRVVFLLQCTKYQAYYTFQNY